jgi:hypothetical protein
MSNDNKPRASINVAVTCALDHNHLSEEDIVAVESIADLNLKVVDMVIEITSLSGLPPDLATAVRVSFEMPDFVESSLLPADGSDNDITKIPDPPLAETSFEAIYFTDATPRVVNVAPKLNYKRCVRIYNVNKKILEWWRDEGLIVRVWGRQMPDAKDAGKDSSYDDAASEHLHLGPAPSQDGSAGPDRAGSLLKMPSKLKSEPSAEDRERMNRMMQQRLRQQVKELQDEVVELKKQLKDCSCGGSKPSAGKTGGKH